LAQLYRSDADIIFIGTAATDFRKNKNTRIKKSRLFRRD
jgi:hypothetical protein